MIYQFGKVYLETFFRRIVPLFNNEKFFENSVLLFEIYREKKIGF